MIKSGPIFNQAAKHSAATKGVMHLFDQSWWFCLIFWAKWDGLDINRCQKPPKIFFDPRGARGATHWTYLLQILSQLCFQRVAFSGNYEIVAIFSDKTTIFKDLNYKADTGQHFHKSEKSARWRHRHKIIKTNLKTHISSLLTRPQGSQGFQKMRPDPLNMPVEVWCAKIAPKLKNIWKYLRKQGFFDIFSSILMVFEVCVF